MNSLFFKVNLVIRRNNFKVFVRFCQKLNKGKQKEKQIKSSPQVVSYLDSTEDYIDIKKQVPNYLLKKYTNSEYLYLINKKTAKEIANVLKNHLDTNSPVIEVNPGFGFLSKELLQCHPSQHFLYESSNHFSKFLEEIKYMYPERVKYKVADFFGLWKLAFQDKLDHGNRLKTLLGQLATDDCDRIVKIVGAMPGLSFVKHLIHCIVFDSASRLGKPDLFIVMPVHSYQFLTDSRVLVGRNTSVTALFQILFDSKILSNVPSAHFLPWMNPRVSKKFTDGNENIFYLVNITQKKKLPCQAEYLPLLWHFFKPHMFSKSTRIIPMLEQWIPGCGIWLITDQDPPDTNTAILPSEDDEKLPHMNIFTQFGDLSLKQKVTLFKRFVSWPGFEQSPFKLTVESNMAKLMSLDSDDDKASIGTPIDDSESFNPEEES